MSSILQKGTSFATRTPKGYMNKTDWDPWPKGMVYYTLGTNENASKAGSHPEESCNETSNVKLARRQMRRRFIQMTKSIGQNVYESWRCF